MYQQHHLPDEDLAYTVLSDLKRVVREYATAATESTCPEVRQMFTHLLNSTLKLQGNLFQAMQSQNMYSTASSALRQEIDKQTKEYQQTQQKTQQYLQQRLGGNQPSFPQYGQFQQQQQHQSHQPYYM
ncbi:Coat F domain-containing protein [Paenibacillus catalpae]|uniref:Coat F domain-containing protein n=1 Tax=Paenibacillus catalpae TaxID=1045775 RepID=A0A1I2AT39_9BACL|nr:spore coat protein [Paenibacillus catalpae]SFE47165.1 Coat F domain-containing protein [Paenibacillus catalpae]